MAMPFNTDMFEVQPSTDAVARKKVPESVAVGSLQRIKPDLKTDWVQKNPYTDNSDSVLRGQRGFQKNCAVCHGNFVDAVHVPSDLMLKGIPSIDLSSEAVRYWEPATKQNPKQDSHFFTYIFNGGVLMPAYGYKLSNSEVWDIVSYVRDAQTKASQKLNTK
jgi:mono/diheme cytochrome c family protein